VARGLGGGAPLECPHSFYCNAATRSSCFISFANWGQFPNGLTSRGSDWDEGGEKRGKNRLELASGCLPETGRGKP